MNNVYPPNILFSSLHGSSLTLVAYIINKSLHMIMNIDFHCYISFKISSKQIKNQEAHGSHRSPEKHFKSINTYGYIIYTTKGRDRFHWAATPLIPYKVGNICYMTYMYSVLYFLNLSLKQFFPHRKRQFLWKYPNPETVIVSCLNVSRMPNRRASQLKIKDIVHCKCISLLN